MAGIVASESAQMERLLTARMYLYTLFHKAFGGTPNGEFLEAVCSEATQDALGEYAQESPELVRAAGFFAGLASANRAELLDSMKDEYVRMFVGPAQLVAYPWESVYVTHRLAACQESTILVREAYRLQGLEPRKLLRVPDDHVSIMCAFLAELARRSRAAFLSGDSAALAAALRVQQAFGAKHVLNWVDEYAAAARRSKTATFYPQAIEAFADFAKVDSVFLGEAAFWAESLEGPCCNGLADACDGAAEACDKLAALKMFGIEDNELVETKL